MVEAQNVKSVSIIRPVSLNNATATSVIVDTKGFNYARIDFQIGASAGALSALKLQEDDASDGNTATDITGAAFTGSDLPGTDSDNDRYSICLPLVGSRKRYLKLVATEDNTGAMLISADAHLSRANEAPNTAAERGNDFEVIL
jgi:hypothetical protein